MKNFFYFIVCAIIPLFLDVQSAYAAFPVHRAAERSVAVKTDNHAFEEFITSAIEKYHRPVAPVGGKEDEGGKILNIATLGLGVAGAIALIAAFLAPALL